MYQHPDQFQLVIKSPVNGYDKHAAIHYHAAAAAFQAKRKAVWQNRWFRLRYWVRSIMFRFVPGIARRMAL